VDGQNIFIITPLATIPFLSPGKKYVSLGTKGDVNDRIIHLSLSAFAAGFYVLNKLLYRYLFLSYRETDRQIYITFIQICS